MLSDQFTETFRDEHRQVRDTLLRLMQAFNERDLPRVRSLLDQTATLTGPHFRYEEEAVYPALTEFFGDEYVEQLYGDHDRAIRTAKQLVELAGKEALTDDDVKAAVRGVRSVLPHVSDCQGLAIMVECLSDAQVQAILDTRERSLKAGLNLLQWADTVRSRPTIPLN